MKRDSDPWLPVSFSTSQVAALVGASERQLDHWARTGLVRPSKRDASGKGTKRRFSFRDVIALKAVVKLREHGCPLQRIRRAVAYLKTHYPSDANADVLARLTLLTDGKQVFMLSDDQQIVEVIRKQHVWAIPLGLYINEVSKEIESLDSMDIPVDVHRQQYRLLVERDPEDGGYVAQCKELPGALTQGATLVELVENAKDAISTVVQYMRRHSNPAGVSTRGKQAG